MKKEFVEEKVRIAKELVDGVEEQFRDWTFVAVLIKLLNDEKKIDGVQKQTDGMKKENHGGIEEFKDIQKMEEELAKKCEISLDELRNVLNINDKKIEIVCRIDGKESEKQVIVSLILFASYEIMFNQPWVKSLVIGETCHAIGIEDRGNNLAKNLKTHSDLFLKRPTANEYRLTTAVGRSVAYKTIRQLAKGEKIDEF